VRRRPARDGRRSRAPAHAHQQPALLGVLTREPAVFGDTRLAQQIKAGNLPPLEELLEHVVDDPAA
jgi:hypothetical protein